MLRRTVLFLCLLAASSQAMEPVRLVIDEPPDLPRAASRLAPGPRPWIPGLMDLVGLTEPGPPIRVLLTPETSPLAQQAPRWIAGYTDGVSNTVVLLPERTPSYPDGGLEDVLAHEVAHVLIYRASSGRSIPRWFNEGLAMLAGRSWGIRDRTQLVLGVLSGERVSLWKLDDLFQGNKSQVENAYALSGLLVQDLIERYGPGLPRALLSRVARGFSFDDALKDATGLTLIEAGESFYGRQTVLRRWVPVITSGAALWFGIAVLAVVAAVKRRRRHREALAKLASEEQLVAAPAPGSGLDEHEDGPVN
jgi:hypothetical protein